MSEAAAEDQAPPAGPELIHAGQYALYRTPSGGLHITFCRTRATNPETREIVPVDSPEDEHLPELPPQVVSLMDGFAASGKRPSPAAILRALLGSRELAGMIGGSDGTS